MLRPSATRKKRRNIWTEGRRDFVREDEQHPKKVLYPRNPDLDPQFVWRGKDGQDAAAWMSQPPVDIHE